MWSRSLHNIIEQMFGWRKEKRRILTRFDKLAKSYAAMVSLACVQCRVCDIFFHTEPRVLYWFARR